MAPETTATTDHDSSVTSLSTANSNADTQQYREIQWSVLESSNNGEYPSDTALQALECASTAAMAFDAAFSLRSKEREQSIPLFDPEEVVFTNSRPNRSTGYFVEYELRAVRTVMDLAKGAFHSHAEQARARFVRP